jgi:hypothetical protein
MNTLNESVSGYSYMAGTWIKNGTVIAYADF